MVKKASPKTPAKTKPHYMEGVLGMPPYAPKIWNYASPIMLLKLVIMLLLCSGNAPKNNGIIGIITA